MIQPSHNRQETEVLNLSKIARELDLIWEGDASGKQPMSHDRIIDLAVAAYWRRRQERR